MASMHSNHEPFQVDNPHNKVLRANGRQKQCQKECQLEFQLGCHKKKAAQIDKNRLTEET